MTSFFPRWSNSIPQVIVSFGLTAVRTASGIGEHGRDPLGSERLAGEFLPPSAEHEEAVPLVVHARLDAEGGSPSRRTSLRGHSRWDPSSPAPRCSVATYGSKPARREPRTGPGSPAGSPGSVPTRASSTFAVSPPFTSTLTVAGWKASRSRTTSWVPAGGLSVAGVFPFRRRRSWIVASGTQATSRVPGPEAVPVWPPVRGDVVSPHAARKTTVASATAPVSHVRCVPIGLLSRSRVRGPSTP